MWTYWCLQCGYVFRMVEKGMQCPHWGIYVECSEKNGYLDEIEFIRKICPTCEYYDDGCQLEDPSKCEQQWQFLCPYESDVSEYPRIKRIFEKQL